MHVHLINNINTKNLQRIIRIGTIRNTMLNYVQNLNLDNTWKVIIYDSDHVGPMSKIGMIDSIERLNFNQELYAICASGTNNIIPFASFLYDSYAYLNIYDKNPIEFRSHNFLKEYTKIISGFSGACLYRLSDLKQCEYILNPNICEHISLHKFLKNKHDQKYKKECFMEMSKKWHIYIGMQPSNK
jgi:hypothetical protein